MGELRDGGVMGEKVQWRAKMKGEKGTEGLTKRVDGGEMKEGREEEKGERTTAWKDEICNEKKKE